MSYYDLYGFKKDNIQEAKSLFESSLSITLEKHDSDYCNDYYRFQNEDGEEFVLKENYSTEEDAYREPDFAKFSIIFYIDESREDKIKLYQKLLSVHESVSLLRREDL